MLMPSVQSCSFELLTCNGKGISVGPDGSVAGDVLVVFAVYRKFVHTFHYMVTMVNLPAHFASTEMHCIVYLRDADAIAVDVCGVLEMGCSRRKTMTLTSRQTDVVLVKYVRIRSKRKVEDEEANHSRLERAALG